MGIAKTIAYTKQKISGHTLTGRFFLFDLNYSILRCLHLSLNTLYKFVPFFNVIFKFKYELNNIHIIN